MARRARARRRGEPAARARRLPGDRGASRAVLAGGVRRVLRARRGGAARARFRALRRGRGVVARAVRALPHDQARLRRGRVDALARAAPRPRARRARRVHARSREAFALREVRAVALLRAVARAPRRGRPARCRPSSATCRSSSPTTAPTSGSTATSSTSTITANPRSSPASRPTTSARPASAGGTRSTGGSASRASVSAGGSSGCASRSRASTPCASITSSATRGTGQSPRDEPTAVKGRWMKGPGARFFEVAREELGELPLIAEDLGRGDARGEARCAIASGSPGSRSSSSPSAPIRTAPDFLPHNYTRRAVVYTGTHDNDTTLGWFHDRGGEGTRATPAQTEKERDAAPPLPRPRRAIATMSLGHDRARPTRRSRDTAIVPMQDVLGLGTEARMNRPGTATATGSGGFETAPRCQRGARDAPRDRCAPTPDGWPPRRRPTARRR